MNTQTFAPPRAVSTFSPSRLEGLATFFRRAQERVSPAATHWLNPEDSIGRYIGKVKWDHIWEATGPARDAFNTVAPKIKSYLENAVEPTSSRVTWSMYMIGRAPSLASPSIIFCCEVLEHRRDVRNNIKDSGILWEYPGIKTGHLPRPPDFDQLVPLGADDQLRHSRGDMLALTSPFKSACGSQLFIRPGGSVSVPQGPSETIGGLICLGGACYYTTAAHALSRTPDLAAADEILPDKDAHDNDDDTLSLDGDEDKYNVSSLDSAIRSLYIWCDSLTRLGHLGGNRHTKNQRPSPWILKQHLEEDLSLPSLTCSGRELSLQPTGRLFFSSMDMGARGAGLDYALIEMTSKHHIVENVIQIGKNGNSVVEVQSVARCEPRDAEILAQTPRGAIKGRISGTLVYSSAPGNRSYNKMFKVSLDGALHNGDCGAWVIHATSGDLFGHVVVGSPGGGTALITPFADIFDDIISRTGELPTFPTARETPASGTIGNTSSPTGEPSTLPSTKEYIANKILPSISIERDKQDDEALDVPSTKVPAKQSHATTPVASESAGDVREREALNRDSTARSLPHKSPSAVDPRSTSVGAACIASNAHELGRLIARRLRPRRHHLRRCKVPQVVLLRNGSLSGVALEDSLSEVTIGDKLSGVALGDSFSGVTLGTLSTQSLLRRFRSRSYIQLSMAWFDPQRRKSEYQILRNVFLKSTDVPMQWEKPELLDLARKMIDLNAIYSAAEKESVPFVSQARAQGHLTRVVWSYQDCVIRRLLSYFSRPLFIRIKGPACEVCSTKLPTTFRGKDQPKSDEKDKGSQVVELFQCSEMRCQKDTRFPRYLDPGTLLRSRRGRAGESRNCFGMFCRALGSRAHLVWIAEDEIWTEVYSEQHQER